MFLITTDARTLVTKAVISTGANRLLLSVAERRSARVYPEPTRRRRAVEKSLFDRSHGQGLIFITASGNRSPQPFDSATYPLGINAVPKSTPLKSTPLKSVSRKIATPISAPANFAP